MSLEAKLPTKEKMKPPAYTAVKNYLIEALESGQMEANSKLPSERGLRQRFGVNRNTVRHAFNQLESEGYVYRSPRRGWFARGSRLVYNPAKHVNFSKLVAMQGMTPSWEVLEAKTFTADHSLATKFEVKKGGLLYLNREIGAIDGLKVYYAEVLFNAKLCPGILPKIEKESITLVLKNEYDIESKQTEILIRPVRLRKKIQNYFGVPTGSPGLFIKRKKTSQHNDIVQIEYEFWRYDAIEIKIDDV